MPLKYVAYYRVSTKRQGRSGLGLEAQQEAARLLARINGATIIAEFTEVETGKDDNRPKLADAIQHAKMTHAQLVIAKIDRLARKMSFTSALMDSGLEFICCDNPNANRLTLHILAAIAEYEAEQISKRTKAALAVAKANGKKLGSSRPGHWDGREERRRAGQMKGLPLANAERSRRAESHYNDVLIPEITRRREEGQSLQEITTWLNEQGFTTRPTKQHPQGCRFTVATVWRLIHRYCEVAA